MKIYRALSIVYPGGQNIAKGIKTIEVRSCDHKVLAARDIYEIEANLIISFKE